MAAVETSFELCVSDPLEVDMQVFALWLRGLTVDQAGRCMLDTEAEWLVKHGNQDLLLAEVGGQYRIFWLLKPYLEKPRQLAAQRRLRPPLLHEHAAQRRVEQAHLRT